MELKNLLYDARDRLLFLTVNRPSVLNSLDEATLTELRKVFEAVREDENVRAVLLTGAGDKAFVAGADIHELSRKDPRSAMALALNGQQVFSMIERLGKPVIAAINGFALGGGCELALACTLRIASATARLGQPEVKLGLIPGFGGTQRLARLIGKGPALELLLTGDLIDAQEALRLGLVNKVVGAEELLPASEAMARKIMGNGPLAIGYCLEAVHRGLEMNEKEGSFLEATLFGMAATTQDMREGTQAFLQKRPPVFTGH